MLSNKQWEDKPSPQIKEYNKLSNEEVPWDLAESNFLCHWNRWQIEHKQQAMLLSARTRHDRFCG